MTTTLTAERTEIDGPDFETCFLCGGELNAHTERRDGVCFGCDIADTPITLLPTETGRAVLAYTDAERNYHSEIVASLDEYYVPDLDAPDVIAARTERDKIRAVLQSLDVIVCDDCGLLDCCCP